VVGKFPMSKHNRIFLISFWALLIGFTYWFVAKTKYIPSGDETISYLCSTGNQELYEQVIKKGGVYGKRTSAGEWKQFLSNHPNSLGNIATDLSKTDLHPPLYFWLLHTFTLLPVGLFNAGLLLNFLLHLAGLLVLLKACRQLELPPPAVFFAAMAWCLSPAVIGVGFYARQYELLGLINLLLFYTFIRYRDGKPLKLLFFMLVIIALGMLTHYLFIYFSFAYAGFVFLVERNKKLTLQLLGVNVLAVLLMLIIHPGIFNQFALQQQRAQEFAFSEMPGRVGKTILAFIQLLLPVLSLKKFLLVLPGAVTMFVLLAIVAATGFFTFRNRVLFSLRKIERTGYLVLWMMLFSAALAVLPYLLFLTPFHAMGGQYLVLVYPYLLIALGLWLGKHLKALTVVLSIMGVGFMLQLIVQYGRQKSYEPMLAGLEKSNLVVVNAVNRRGFLRLVPYLNSQQIIMDEQATPCLHPEENVMFISEEPLNRPACKEVNVYDLQDGVTFYMVLTSSCACAEPRSK
jgi:hypothetical protein